MRTDWSDESEIADPCNEEKDAEGLCAYAVQIGILSSSKYNTEEQCPDCS